MLTLYHNDMSVCAAKVRTALAAKKLDWNGVHLDLRRGDAQKPEYLKLNPNAVVPTLVHDGRVVCSNVRKGIESYFVTISRWQTT
jgi:glutathione S-transferase